MKGMLMKPENIKATIEGRKTVTRRLSGLKEINQEPDRWSYEASSSLPKQGRFTFFYDNQKPYNRETATLVVKPRYKIGETVFLQEAWATESVLDHLSASEIAIEGTEDVELWYKLDMPINTSNERGRWRSPRFMPAWVARYFVKILGIKFIRLKSDMTTEDCIREGLPLNYQSVVLLPQRFQEMWDAINPRYPFDGNWWVFRYEYELVNP